MESAKDMPNGSIRATRSKDFSAMIVHSDVVNSFSILVVNNTVTTKSPTSLNKSIEQWKSLDARLDGLALLLLPLDTTRINRNK